MAATVAAAHRIKPRDQALETPGASSKRWPDAFAVARSPGTLPSADSRDGVVVIRPVQQTR